MTSSRAAVAGWALAASVYLLAVLHRTSLGVAGLLAEQRFGISPAQLSIFIFLQLGVYAAMQVPTGILVDRYGPRRVLVTAALLMGAAQLVFALVPLYPVALLARGVLGCGDALTFISVLRFAATHFTPQRYPLLVASTAMFGTVGNVAATLPLALVLRHLGWAPAFAGAAVLSLLAGGAVAALLPDSTPPPRAVRTRAELRTGALAVGARIRGSWALPGTRLGFWTHFAAMSSATAFGVLWATPYLVEVLGFSTAGASTVLLGGVVLAAVVAPGYGWLIGQRPHARVPIALGVSGVTVAGLVALVLCGYSPPAGFVVALFVVMATGVPVSMAAFALARDYNHQRTLGTASGLVNVGGFLAAVIIALGIGALLDVLGGIDAQALRWALLVAIGVQGVGMWRLVVWYLRVRRDALHLQSLGHEVPVFVVRRRFDLRGPDLHGHGSPPASGTMAR